MREEKLVAATLCQVRVCIGVSVLSELHIVGEGLTIDGLFSTDNVKARSELARERFTVRPNGHHPHTSVVGTDSC